MILGEMIKAYRWKKELGLREVAKEIGTTHGTLSRIENGEEVDGRTLIKIFIWATREQKEEKR